MRGVVVAAVAHTLRSQLSRPMRPIIRSASSRALVGLMVPLFVLAACGPRDGDANANSTAGSTESGRPPTLSLAVQMANAQTPPISPFEEAAAKALPSTVFILVEARPRQTMFPLFN